MASLLTAFLDRRMDILNADLALSNEVNKWNRAKNSKKRKGGARKSQAKAKKRDEEEPGFHFIAYVPINGIVWRLDGMQRQPANLGECDLFSNDLADFLKGEAGKDWMRLARDNINLHIAQHIDDGLQFSLMSLCRSPLQSIPEKLAESLHAMSAVENVLSTALPDWKQFVEIGENSPPLAHVPNESFALSKELLANSLTPESVQRKLKVASTDPTELIDIRRELLIDQIQLQNSYVEETALIEEENEQAARRKIDYTPIIYNSMKELAEQGVLKEIVRDLIDSGKMKPS